ncbi:MAG: 3TM-type holin [Gammaproteobacteria bacterium]|nr:3TM-type holin [Gammaproteobacteria bacterium]
MDKEQETSIEATAETVVTETTKKVGKIRGWFRSVKTKFGNLTSGISDVISNEKAADGIMRWPRPVAFFMIVIMFCVGWFHPATLLAFAQALAAFPESFWTVIFIILGSIGVSKGANDIVKIISSRKP